MNRLSLLIPGLLGPLPELKDSPLKPPACTSLQRWLARGELRHTGHADYFDQLSALLGLPDNLALASVAARVDRLLDPPAGPGEGQLLRADPVHFRAELDHALLIASEQLDILDHEADALVEHFNAHFAEDGLRLLKRHRQRWYLQVREPLKVSTVPLHRAAGRNVQHFLPGGEDEMRWRKILNEAQMLFFSHDINLARETRGQLSINSLWLWGEGDVDDSAETRSADVDWVMADEVHARGMALSAGCQACELDADLSAFIDAHPGHGLLVIDAAFLPTAWGDVPGWVDAVSAICEQWIEPVQRLLAQKRIDAIDLYSADGLSYHISRRHLLKFWRRPRALERYINHHA